MDSSEHSRPIEKPKEKEREVLEVVSPDSDVPTRTHVEASSEASKLLRDRDDLYEASDASYELRYPGLYSQLGDLGEERTDPPMVTEADQARWDSLSPEQKQQAEREADAEAYEQRYPGLFSQLSEGRMQADIGEDLNV